MLHAFVRPARLAASIAMLAAVAAFVGCDRGADGRGAAEGASDAETRATARARGPLFTDVTGAAGIDFVHANGAEGEKLLPETMGGGVAFVDFDGDHAPDLLFVDSAGSPRLYLGDGAGGFEDVSRAAGLATIFVDDPADEPAGDGFYGMGLAVGDVDADGRLDVFLTALGGDRLLRGTGEAGSPRFVDVTAPAGVGGQEGSGSRWSTGAAFADLDGDGWLDLVVARYVEWSREVDLELDFDIERGARGYRPPFSFRGLDPRVYRNRGDGTFEDVTALWGFDASLPDGSPAAKALAVLPVDVDEDGDLDLFVANDTTPNQLYQNELVTDGRFVEIAVEAGVAFAPNGLRTGAMGVDFAQRHPSGSSSAGDATELSIAVGNFDREATSLFVTRGASGLFDDLAAARGLVVPTTPALTFGLLFFDADLDGDLDLFQANGHIEPDIAVAEPGQSYEQPPQLFLFEDSPRGPRYELASADEIGDLARPLVGRGAAAADMDGDGDLDLIITQIGRAPVLLRNDLLHGDRPTDGDRPNDAHWLRVRLEGRAPNLDAIGARVTIETPEGTRQHRTVQPARSYLSAIELPVSFGLGAQDSVTRLIVRWPDGTTTERRDVAANQLVVVAQAVPGS